MPTIDSSQAMGAASDTQLATKKQLTSDDFIKLFIKQLTTQNPLHPADSSTMLQQMADISMISASKASQEAITELKQSLNLTLGNSQLINSTNLIGKKIEVEGDKSSLIKDEGMIGAVATQNGTTNVKVVIKNDAGEVVRELELGTPAKALAEFKWDGLKSDGKTTCPEGTYHISATGTLNGTSVPLKTAGAFKVKSVGLSQTGKVLLNADGLDGFLSIDNIVKIL